MGTNSSKRFRLQKAGLMRQVLVRLLRFAGRSIFHKVHFHTPGNTGEINLPWPGVLFANHVTETDIYGLLSIYPKLHPKMKYIFPVREDLLQKNFLVNEFRPRGFKKFLFGIIDRTGIIPGLLKYMGGFGVKRPFRDNARELARQGKLREIVNGQWEELGREVGTGKNLFLFPEGTFSVTGWINIIRNGPNILHGTLDNPEYIPITFTYDMLSYVKPVLHIAIGTPFRADAEPLSDKIRNALSAGYTVTPANLSALLITEFNGISEDRYIEYYFRIAEKVKSANINFSPCLEDMTMPDKLFKKMLSGGYVKLENGEIFHTDKMEKHHGNLIRKNPWFYHANQLHGFKGQLLSGLQP